MNQKNGRTDPGPLRERARSLFISKATIDETLEWATPRQLDAIDRMLATELANREASKRARLMRQARFPVPKSLDGYDFANVRLPDGYTKEQLTGLDFAAKAQDLVFYGKTGRGKTHLATALGMLAVERGRSVRFRQTAELVLQLGKAKRDGALDSLLKDLARADLIILDEFGYVPFDIDGARLLYQIIAGSYERRSIILRHEHRVRQMGDDLRRRQTRRRDHQPHRPPRTPHRIHRPQPTRQPSPHVRQDGQPVKQTTGRHSSCRKPKKTSDETRNTDLTKNSRTAADQPVFRRPAATPEQECHKAPAALGTQMAVYEDSIGQLILQWLRKPTYWSEGSSGTQALWHAYTPEPVTPSELALSRQACGVACDAQPVIKGTLPNRDIAHMAATSLGYLTWGVTNDPMDYGLGDLGGWALDLLQIWGSYLANTPKEDLASWLHAHLGEQDARMGFSYSDVLADCDAWLLARSMQSNSSERSLSTAMRDMFAQSETNRIKRFYQSRFKGSADNLVIAFRKLVDGIDLGIFDNVSGSKKALLIASHADRLPSQAEAGILALSYAESLENPNR